MRCCVQILLESHSCMALHYLEPFIITLPSSRCDLDTNKRDVKHPVIIMRYLFMGISDELATRQPFAVKKKKIQDMDWISTFCVYIVTFY